MRQVLAAAALAAALAGCGGSVPHGAPATTPPSQTTAAAAAASPAPGAAFCATLRTSSSPRLAYSAEVEHQVSLAAGSGSVTMQDIQAGEAIVALWITISCPRYAWLTKG